MLVSVLVSATSSMTQPYLLTVMLLVEVAIEEKDLRDLGRSSGSGDDLCHLSLCHESNLVVMTMKLILGFEGA